MCSWLDDLHLTNKQVRFAMLTHYYHCSKPPEWKRDIFVVLLKSSPLLHVQRKRNAGGF